MNLLVRDGGFYLWDIYINTFQMLNVRHFVSPIATLTQVSVGDSFNVYCYYTIHYI